MSVQETIDIWGIPLALAALTPDELHYLEGLPDAVPPNEWVWAEMDRVWDEMGLDNTEPLDSQPIGAFYQHPVWIMNGAFSASDSVSNQHRIAISEYISESGANEVADYGGGFGELALQVAVAAPTSRVSIIEPFPSRVGMSRVELESRVRFVPATTPSTYDVIIAQDVLEHVEDPIGMAIDLARAVRPGGQLIFANNFTPIIKCHLPSTFHLRRTFRYVMRALGLGYVGPIRGAEHALVFTVDGELQPSRALTAASVSRRLGPLLNRV